MIGALAYALAGMQAASTRLAARSENVANVSTSGYRPAVPVQTSTAVGPAVRIERGPAPDPAFVSNAYGGSARSFPPPSNVRLEHDLTDVLLSKNAYKAAASVAKTAIEMQDETIDLLS
jgi:flagellar hook protein FlgE